MPGYTKKRKYYKKLIVGKLTTFADTSSFDRLFWKKAGAHARFAAMWKSIDEFYKIRGINGDKLRLQRSVENIKRAQS